MEFSDQLPHLFECETFPILTVKDGIIKHMNIYGSELGISINTPVNSLIHSGLADYERFNSGVLFLTLAINDVIQNAAVVRHNKEDIFILDPQNITSIITQANNIRQQIQKPLNDAMISLDILSSNPELKQNIYIREMRKSMFQLLNHAVDMRADIEYTRNMSSLLPNQNLTEFISAYLNICKPQVEGTGYKLKYSVPEKQILCSVDHEAIKFALANMISTAMKYGKRNRTLNLKMASHPNRCTISVSNLMKDDTQFERFYTDNILPQNVLSNTVSTTPYSGFRTLRAIACQHNGSVHVECTNEKTMKITFSIPAGMRLFKENANKLRTYFPSQFIHSGGYDPMLIVLSDILPGSFYK